MFKLYHRIEAWIEEEKENSQSLLYRDLIFLYLDVASILDLIDALYIDRDLGCLNMSEVRYAKRNLAFAIKRYKQLLRFIILKEWWTSIYIFYRHFNGRGSQGTAHVPPVKN